MLYYKTLVLSVLFGLACGALVQNDNDHAKVTTLDATVTTQLSTSRVTYTNSGGGFAAM